MKKFVLKLELKDDKVKRKALKTVAALPGIDEIYIDLKGKTLTVIGIVDPVILASKLRKYWPTDILSVGPAKEPTKKEEPKMEEAKKEEPKKVEAKKEEAGKVLGTTIMPPYRPYYPPMMMPYRPYYPPVQTNYHTHHSIEEDPNACIIC